jgi:hypothetical protein
VLKEFKGKFLAVIVLLLFAYSCKQRVICPAYTSFFILDPVATRSKFSHFAGDTSFIYPKGNSKPYTVKGKYGIIVKVKKRKNLKDHYTLSMETLFPPAIDTADTAYNDTLYTNIDQAIYDHLIASKIRDPYKPRKKKEIKKEENTEEGFHNYEGIQTEQVDSVNIAPVEKEKKGLFRKKKKKTEDKPKVDEKPVQKDSL